MIPVENLTLSSIFGDIAKDYENLVDLTKDLGIIKFLG